jgi:hypothetical protein
MFYLDLVNKQYFLTNFFFFTVPEQNTTSSLDPKKAAEASPTVRFASVNEEIEPANIGSLNAPPSLQGISGNDVEKLKEISKSLQGTHLQERRMSHFAFEPVSLPTSRVRIPRSLYIKSGASERQIWASR